jgi:putative hydrolase of HD superfamily
MKIDDDTLLQFWQAASHIKRLRRQGWLDRGVRDPESVADHSWGVAFLAWLLAATRADLSRERVLLLGLVHDLPEALAGDATPFDTHRDAGGAISDQQLRAAPAYSDEERTRKRAQESAALDTMLAGMPDQLARQVSDAWHEYDQDETPEASFVHQVDKLETLFQALAFAATQPALVIESFKLGALRDVTDPALAALVARLLRPEEDAPPA